jgi:hypothetical protein
MNRDELLRATNAHQLWLNHKNGGPSLGAGTRLVCNDAVLRGVDLFGARLSEALLAGADLSDAALGHARLYRADLRGTKLRGASLFRADLSCADLAEADLTDAGIRHAIWTGANLTGVTGLPVAPVVPDLHKQIAEAVGQDGENLDMLDWHHPCGTTHCRAGWAITLAGDAGEWLESKFGGSTAGALIYWASTGMIPEFFAEYRDALEDIRRCAGQ